MKYQPGPTPLHVRDVVPWAANELRRIADAQGTQIVLEVLQTEPREAPNGTIAYADGVSWDPGAGEGFYGREAGVWVKL